MWRDERPNIQRCARQARFEVARLAFVCQERARASWAGARAQKDDRGPVSGPPVLQFTGDGLRDGNSVELALMAQPCRTDLVRHWITSLLKETPRPTTRVRGLARLFLRGTVAPRHIARSEANALASAIRPVVGRLSPAGLPSSSGPVRGRSIPIPQYRRFRSKKQQKFERSPRESSRAPGGLYFFNLSNAPCLACSSTYFWNSPIL